MPLFNAAERRTCMDTWNALPGSLQENGMVIYKRMFETYPEMKALFHFFNDADADAQLQAFALRVMRKLDITISQLDTPAIMAADLKSLGSRHPGYNVNPNKHVQPMKDSLVYMLRTRLGAKFTPEVESAWGKCFDEISNLMLR